MTSTATTIPPENKVFIGNLSYFCTHDQLVRLCEPFGQVRNVYICKSKENTPLYYGFAYFAAVESAQRTIRELNGQFFMGRRLCVNRGELKQKAPKVSPGIQLLISFLSDQSEISISESLLVSFLSKYGSIEDCVVKNHHLHNTNESSLSSSMKSKQGGYGFVWFEDLSSAEQVVRELTNVVVTVDKNISVLLDIKFSKSTSSTIKPSGSKQQPPIETSPLGCDTQQLMLKQAMLKPPRIPFSQNGRTTSHSPIANSPTSIATSGSASSPFLPTTFHISESHGYPQQHSHMEKTSPVIPAPSVIQSTSPSMMGPLSGSSSPPLYQPGASVPYPISTAPIYYLPQQYPIAPSSHPPTFPQNHNHHIIPMQLAQPAQPHMAMMVMQAPMHFYPPMSVPPSYATHFIPS